MKRVLFLLLAIGVGLLLPTLSYADKTVTVTATSSDISENLDLKTVATLFGQAKDLEQFEQLLNDPDSALRSRLENAESGSLISTLTVRWTIYA